MTQRFSKFGNAPELSNIWQMTADVRVADEVPEMVAARPRIVDEQGKAKRIVIATPADKLLDYMQTLVERADKLKGKPEKGGDNMLRISGDARKASLDMRLVSPMAPVNPDGKVAVACKKITDIYKETGKDKGTQLVFLDIGTPKAKEKEPEFDKDGNIINEESDETVEEAALLKDVYKSIKQRLVANGVAEKVIALIHDAKNQDQRRSLSAKVNSGEIRVLIGSTGKMGAGVNVQERAAALHHLDAPWRPRDIEQREGPSFARVTRFMAQFATRTARLLTRAKASVFILTLLKEVLMLSCGRQLRPNRKQSSLSCAGPSHRAASRTLIVLPYQPVKQKPLRPAIRMYSNRCH